MKTITHPQSDSRLHGVISRFGPAFAHGGGATVVFTTSRRLRLSGHPETITVPVEAIKDGDLDVLSLSKPGDTVSVVVAREFGKFIAKSFVNHTLDEEG